MFNLNDIFQASQGGQAMENLARQYGISVDQANEAVKALIPAMSMGLQQQASNMDAMGAMFGKMFDPRHQEAFETPDPAPAEAGEEVVNGMFGSSDNASRVAEHAAAAAGLPPDLMGQIMQSVASTMMGGLGASLQNQGMGGLFGQLANAAGQGGLGSILGQMMGGGQSGGLGSILGQMMGGAQQPQAPAGGGLGSILGQMMGGGQQPQAPAGGGLGGMLGNVLGGMFGGGQQAPQQSSAPAPGGFDPATLQAGMEMLGKMFQPGVQAGGAQQAGLQDLFGQMFGGKR